MLADSLHPRRLLRRAAIFAAARFGLMLSPTDGEVLAIHVPGGRERTEYVRELFREAGCWPRTPSGVLVLILDADVLASVELKLKPAEDLGYGSGNRETANVAVDADAAAESKRAICGATPTR